LYFFIEKGLKFRSTDKIYQVLSVSVALICDGLKTTTLGHSESGRSLCFVIVLLAYTPNYIS